MEQLAQQAQQEALALQVQLAQLALQEQLVSQVRKVVQDPLVQIQLYLDHRVQRVPQARRVRKELRV